MNKDNKALRITVDVILICVAFVFLYFGVKEAIEKIEATKIADDVKFNRSYRDVEKGNLYRYIDEKKMNALLKESGVFFRGNPDDSWSQVVAKPLYDVIKDHGIEEIYYFETDKNVPCIVVVRDGDVLVELQKDDLFDEEFEGSPIEYFEDEDRKNEFEESLKCVGELKE